MDWKEYEVKPDDGMFEAVQRRIKRRRYWSIAAAAVAEVFALVVLTMPKPQAVEPVQVVEPVQQEFYQTSTVTEDATVPMLQPTAVKSLPVAEQEDVAVAVLPQAQMQVVPVEEPEAEQLFDAGLFEQLATVQPTTQRVSATVVDKEETVDGEQQTGAAEKTNAKVGSAEPAVEGVEGILWAPNIITPNGDVVKNRTFRVVASSDVSEFHIYIYNRGGRLIFRSGNIEEEWDARHNGVQVPQGAYVWVATFRDAEGTSHREAGTVTVVW